MAKNDSIKIISFALGELSASGFDTSELESIFAQTDVTRAVTGRFPKGTTPLNLEALVQAQDLVESTAWALATHAPHSQSLPKLGGIAVQMAGQLERRGLGDSGFDLPDAAVVGKWPPA
jgi:hypothetical protein